MTEQNSDIDFEQLEQERKERRSRKELYRVQYAEKELQKLGYATEWWPHDKVLTFKYKGHIGRIFPYTGWYSVKGIGSGRGIKVLIKELRRKSNESH